MLALKLQQFSSIIEQHQAGKLFPDLQLTQEDQENIDA
jgi:hypothetical protein